MADMDVQLIRDKERLSASWRFGTASDAELLGNWAKHVSINSSDYVLDAAEFAKLAVERWSDYARKSLAAKSTEDAKNMCSDLPEEELVGLLILSADWWLDPTQPIAFAYFRRTWSGGIYLEFMAGHPLAEGYVKGILRAILHALAQVAETIGGEWIWWETTKGSFPKYETLIGKQNFLSGTAPRIKDVFAISTVSLQGLLSRDKETK